MPAGPTACAVQRTLVSGQKSTSGTSALLKLWKLLAGGRCRASAFLESGLDYMEGRIKQGHKRITIHKATPFLAEFHQLPYRVEQADHVNSPASHRSLLEHVGILIALTFIMAFVSSFLLQIKQHHGFHAFPPF